MQMKLFSDKSTGRKSAYWWSFLFALPLSLTLLRKWLHETFAQFSLEQLIFHLRFGAHGLLAGDRTLAVDFLREVVIVPFTWTLPIVGGVALAGAAGARRFEPMRPASPRFSFRGLLVAIWVVSVLAGMARYAYRTNRSYAVEPATLLNAVRYMIFEPTVYVALCAVCLGAVILLSAVPGVPQSYRKISSLVLSVPIWTVFTSLAIVCFMSLFPLSSYAELFSEPDPNAYLDRNYVKPDFQPSTQRRSLVLVYVESLEQTYRKLGQESLLTALDQSTGDWIDTGSFVQVSGTGWTTAALVATQCGLPLRPPVGKFDRPNDDLSMRAAILPKATCLGDILKQAGYKNVFLTGSSLDFGGLNEFISSHGYSDTRGKEDWIAEGESDISEWGLTDDRLLERAKEEFDSLVSAGTPFNLTVLTIDNHGPGGILNRTCRQQGAVSFSDILRCNTKLVADFLSYVHRKDPNVAIVVAGDHLVHENPLLGLLQSQPKRYVYGRLYSPDGKSRWRSLVSHFDFYPTILDLLNFSSPSERAGLGASFIGEEIKNYENPLSNPDYNRQLREKSRLYTDMWR